ncbi:MAG: hypothetical protein HOQ24_19150 [Mycobacteriaceae bacterium]|nr:hypothetical protein [Mycobacteriaceae bacterium]
MTLVRIVVAGWIAVAGALTGAGHASALPPAGLCTEGEFRWTAVNGAIGMQRTLLTFASTGVLRGCTGGPAGITGGTFVGTHVAWSDCMHPADGPITVKITWSNGQSSTLYGPWPVGLAQPADGPLDVIDGLGRGMRARIIAWYEMMTPEMVSGCMGSGVHTGVGRVSGTTFHTA